MLWNDRTGFYYDWGQNSKQHDVLTIAGFWTLLSDVADTAQGKRLTEHFTDTNKFGRLHMVPTVPADEKGYDPRGGYWRGSIWTPTTMMVVRGLERYKYNRLARDIALNHLRNVVTVFKKTGTLWENYAPDSIAPGTPSKPDFVGWTGLAPITLLIEFTIGIKIDATSNSLAWNITSSKRVGINNLWFGGRTVSLICEALNSNGQRMVTVKSDKQFRLKLITGKISRTMKVQKGSFSVLLSTNKILIMDHKSMLRCNFVKTLPSNVNAME